MKIVIAFLQKLSALHHRVMFMVVLAMNGVVELKAQCLYSPVIASDYFTGECGEKKMQQLFDVRIPVYGNSGSLFFTSPLTENVIISSIETYSNQILRIYPNPTDHYVTIDWPYADEATVYVLTAFGQSISYSVIQPFTKSTIDMQNLHSGYYLIKVVSSNNKSFISKLIKQ